MIKPCIKCGVVPDVAPPRYKKLHYVCNECHRIYCKNKGYKHVYSRYKEYRKQPKELIKYQARIDLYWAIKNGSVIKMPCSVCGERKVEGHHEDYSKPLDVIWLCKKHHMAIHDKKKAEGGE